MIKQYKKLMTLCVVLKDGEVLLGMKKRGFGEGQWNGFGGKVVEGESIEDAARRELEEESGIRPRGMTEVGILEFAFEGDPKVLETHVFKIGNFEGEPLETEEMMPKWFKFEQIPFEQMWPDDRYWFPYLLGGKSFRGKFLFDKPSTPDYQAKIISQELVEL